jgi:hypothetical protein
VVVAGSGSTLKSEGAAFSVGHDGPKNRMEIRDEALVLSGNFSLGDYCNSNTLVLANGGMLQCGNSVTVGDQGSSNVLFIANGSVSGADLAIGRNSAGCDNLLRMASGNLTITNGTGDGVFEVRHGKLILNGGTLRCDRFIMTNLCAQFVRTGGTLIYGAAVLDPTRDDDGDGMPNGYEQSYGLDPLNPTDGTADSEGDGQNNSSEYLAGTDPTNGALVFRITEIWPDDADMLLTWSAVGGKRYILQTTTGAGGGFSNNFIDLNPAVVAPGSNETEVSVLHLGAATNSATRFYRARLVP